MRGGSEAGVGIFGGGGGSGEQRVQGSGDGVKVGGVVSDILGLTTKGALRDYRMNDLDILVRIFFGGTLIRLAS